MSKIQKWINKYQISWNSLILHPRAVHKYYDWID